MSYKIVQPSTNSDRVTRFGVSSGASDNVITFPNESGEIAVTSDIPVVTTPPPTIYQFDPDTSNLVSTSTVYQTIPGTTVTGLEANYLYRLTLIGEITSPDGDTTYSNNFKIKATTAAGNQSPSWLDVANLWLAYDGGVQVNITGFSTKLFPPMYSIWDTGWNLRESESNGTGAKANIRLLYKTGTDADSRSVKFQFALSTTATGATSVTWVGGWTTLVLEPIRPF